jgi:hypothetical protein
MNSTSRQTLLGVAAVMALGLLVGGVKPAAADPPAHAPAWGWRRKQSTYNNNSNRRYYDNGSYRYGSGYRYNSRNRYYRPTRSDIDGDGIPNSRDRDIDGDGIANYRDRTPYGSRYSSNTRRRSAPVYARRYVPARYHRKGDADRDGIRNRRDRDIDGDGRRNWRDRDRDGDRTRNRRDRYPRNPRRR